MNILITGGSGFLGARLARTLLARASLSLAGAPARTIESITLADRAPPPADLQSDKRVRFAGGDLNEQIASGALPAPGTDLVFHVAAVSGECEADFDLGMRSNLQATLGLPHARQQAHLHLHQFGPSCGWCRPGRATSHPRARSFGLESDPDFETVIRDYIRENPGAVKLPLR